MTIKYTLTNNPNFSDTISLNFCIAEDYTTAREAQERLSFLLSVLDVGSAPQPPIIRRQWTDAEIAVILGAATHNEAIQRYRTQFPTSTRTEYSITKKLTKLRRTEPVVVKASDIKIPVSTVDEVTLHEPLPVPEQPVISCRDHDDQKTHKKNSWLPDEDEIVKSAPTLEDAIRMHGGAFPGKRTPGAIGARWRTMNPTQLQKLKEIAASTSTSDLPARGANVRITGQVGRASGKTGTVIRRDQRIGEILVNAGNEGCVWLKPTDVEAVE